MSSIRRFDHVGITVADLDTVTAFFVGLGFEVEGRTVRERRVRRHRHWHIELPYRDRHAAAARRRTNLELSTFIRPDHEPGSPDAMANELACATLASKWSTSSDVDRLAADGYGLVGGIGQHEDSWRMRHVRGPEGIIVSLAQRID